MILVVSLEALCLVESCVDLRLSFEQTADLRELLSSRGVSADVAVRARVVLWSGEGRRRKDIAELLGISARTVDRCKVRYAERGLAGLEDRPRGRGREQAPPRTRARVIALTRMSPLAGTGLSHWSTRTLADRSTPSIRSRESPREINRQTTVRKTRGPSKTHIQGLNLFFQAIRRHRWDDTCPARRPTTPTTPRRSRSRSPAAWPSTSWPRSSPRTTSTAGRTPPAD
ncbi:helix-turn-helix domain-containing protein [Streptomyces sp. NPDC001404]|uniref:helix-turn-helix domain-containing protein n=1 Tax=Streptomyces sp. NPDC001404 TaxID=3364571 RepID=UPI0036A79FA9